MAPFALRSTHWPHVRLPPRLRKPPPRDPRARVAGDRGPAGVAFGHPHPQRARAVRGGGSGLQPLVRRARDATRVSGGGWGGRIPQSLSGDEEPDGGAGAGRDCPLRVRHGPVPVDFRAGDECLQSQAHGQRQHQRHADRRRVRGTYGDADSGPIRPGDAGDGGRGGLLGRSGRADVHGPPARGAGHGAHDDLRHRVWSAEQIPPRRYFPGQPVARCPGDARCGPATLHAQLWHDGTVRDPGRVADRREPAGPAPARGAVHREL